MKRTRTTAKQRRIRLVTLATMTACTATRNSLAQNAAQTTVPYAALAAVAEPPNPTIRFAIPAGPLPAVLDQYQAITGIRLSITLAPETIATFQSTGVTGVYAPEAALRLLLTGTGLTAHPIQNGQVSSFQIGLRQTESVDVTASLPSAVSMQKFTEPLLDTPQSVVAVPQFVLQDQAVSTLRDSLRNVPGISLAAGESGAQGDNLTIRGFTARNDIFLDGIRDFGSYYRDSFNYEQVDVLEGPAGIQFGRGSTGGVINQESKLPQLGSPDPGKPFAIVTAQGGTNATRRLTADLDQPLPHVANGTALRLNLMGVESGVAGRDYAEIRRYGVAPSISVGLNAKTHATLSYVHLQEDDTPDYGLPWLFNQLAPGVNRHSYFGFASANAHGINHLNTNDDILTLRAGHDFGHDLDLHTIARAANYPRNVQITEPQICSNAAVSVPVGGTVTALPTSSVTGAACPYTLASSPASVLVNRNQIQIKSVEGDLWEQTELTARFKTFGLRHALVAGVEGGQEISNPIKYAYTINKLNSVPSTTLLNPNEQAAFAGTGYIASITHTKSDSVGTYFVDTIHLGRLFELSGGVRFDRFDTNFNLYQPTPPAGATVTAAIPSIEQVVQQPTYRAAFVYKPSSHGSVYFDYGTSFNPSAESLSLSVSSSVLPPEENETYEGGAKWSFLKDRLMTEAAVFRTEKDNARETDPTNSNNIVLAGNQLVKGVQFSVVGRLPEGTDLIAGYAYLSSQVLYSQIFRTSIGYPLANVPKQTFNVFLTHRLPFDFKAGLGGNYVASRTASSTVPYVPLTFSGPNTVGGVTTYTVLSTGMKQVPGYWVFNAMLSRSITEHIQLQVNVNNLFNRFYIDEPHPSHLIPGEGANALIGLNYKF
jgi:catecholate siderophore receptor